MSRPFFYGGQAVIEGVMMRGQHSMAVAVRRPTGEILLRSRVFPQTQRHELEVLPIMRGMLALWEALTLGMQTLLFSSRAAAGQEDAPNSAGIWTALAIALSFVAVVFFLGPLLLTAWLGGIIPNHLVVLLIEGGVRLTMLLVYVRAIGYVPGVRRVFEYHGAEHKTINAFEAGAPLEAHELRRFSTSHTRCGTGFLLVVMVLSVLVFAALGTPPLWLRLLSRVALIPMIGSLAYEYVRFAAAHMDNRLVRWLVRPNLALQSFTTREPDDAQLEVAVAALQQVLAMDGVREQAYAVAEDFAPSSTATAASARF